MSANLAAVIALALAVTAGLVITRLLTRALSRRVRALRSHRCPSELLRIYASIRALLTPPGPRRTIARLRDRLRLEMNQTHQVASHVAVGSDVLAAAARELDHQCAQLDRRLKLLAREPSTDYLTELLPGLRAQSARLGRDALLLRRNLLALDSIGAVSAELTQRELEDQLAGLHAGIADVRAIAATSVPLGGRPSSHPRRQLNS